MYHIYVYVFDTLADWELGYVTAELHSGRYFKKDAPAVSLTTVGITKEPVRTMGGLRVIPDCVVDDVAVDETSVLLLPGGTDWDDPKHGGIIRKAGELLSAGAAVCAICGATAGHCRPAGPAPAYKQRSGFSGIVLSELSGTALLCGRTLRGGRQPDYRGRYRGIAVGEADHCVSGRFCAGHAGCVVCVFQHRRGPAFLLPDANAAVRRDVICIEESTNSLIPRGTSPFVLFLVRVVGVEPTRIAPQEPKSCASANSAIPAYFAVRYAYYPGR